MRSSSTTSLAGAALAVTLLAACQASPKSGSGGVTDTTHPASGALAGPVVGDTSAIKAVPVQSVQGSGGHLTLLTVTLSDEQGGAPPAYVAIASPDGKQAGMRRGWPQFRQDITGATYHKPLDPNSSDEPPLETNPQLMLGQFIAGRYVLLVSGVAPRRYLISIRAQREQGRPFGVGEWNGLTAPGAVDTVLIDVGPGLDTAVAARSRTGS